MSGSSQNSQDAAAAKTPRSAAEMTKTELFDLTVQSPSMWLFQAVGLTRAAYALWNRHQHWFDDTMKRPSGVMMPKELFDVTTNRFATCYMLLAGLAIENLVKGLLVARSTGAGRPGHLPKGVSGHDLGRLFDDVGIALNDGEKRLVDELREAVVWKGRYATPKHENKLSRQSYMAYARLIHHPKEVTALFLRVADQYPHDFWRQVRGQSQQYPEDFKEWVRWMTDECPQ